MSTFRTTFYGNTNMVTAVMFLLTGYLRVPRCMKLSWGIFARLMLEVPCIIHDKQPGFESVLPHSTEQQRLCLIAEVALVQALCIWWNF